MRVHLIVSCKSDQLFCIPKQKFLGHFDQLDFLCRDRKVVIPAYLEEWFTSSDTSPCAFHVPSVQFIAGRTQFISGRHRIAVLLPHLEELPISFTVINSPPLEFRALLALRSVVNDELFELPDLPIKARLP
jgi:hypothetical protein